MDEIGNRVFIEGIGPPVGGPPASACTSRARRTSFHVHATPAVAVADMDLRRRQWMEWLMHSRCRSEAMRERSGATRERSEGGISG